MCVQDCSPDPHFCRTRSKPARGGVPRALGSAESEVTGKESGGHSVSLPSLATSKPDFPLKQPHTGHCGAGGKGLGQWGRSCRKAWELDCTSGCRHLGPRSGFWGRPGALGSVQPLGTAAWQRDTHSSRNPSGLCALPVKEIGWTPCPTQAITKPCQLQPPASLAPGSDPSSATMSCLALGQLPELSGRLIHWT